MKYTNSNNEPTKVRRTEKRGSIKKKHGIYMAAVSALVIAIVIVFNLFIGSLPDGTLEYDISEKGIYTVTQQSVDYLENLDKDVHIVVLAQEAAIDERISKFINNYAKLSSHITLEVIDPVLNPTALETYAAQENNIVISCADTNKTRVLMLGGIYGYEDGLILYDPEYAYYGQFKPVALDAEGQLTSAVNYVTSGETNKLYLLEGHGEAALGTTASDAIAKSNIETASLDLMKEGSIPSDCELLISHNPMEDLTADELDMLVTYLKTGGNVLLLLDSSEFANFNVLLETYGLQMQNGIVADAENYYKVYTEQYGYFCIYPVLSASDSVTSAITSDALLRFSHGLMEITPLRRGAVVSPFLTTSDKGLLVIDDNTTLEGQYILGATSIETFDNADDTQSRLTVIAAVDLLSDDIPTSFSNADIFINAVSLNFGEVQNLVIPTKSLDVQINTIAHPGVWSILFIGIIPLALIVGGLVYWIRRRNR